MILNPDKKEWVNLYDKKGRKPTPIAIAASCLPIPLTGKEVM
jgi:hypothetical protein